MVWPGNETKDCLAPYWIIWDISVVCFRLAFSSATLEDAGSYVCMAGSGAMAVGSRMAVVSVTGRQLSRLAGQLLLWLDQIRVLLQGSGGSNF